MKKITPLKFYLTVLNKINPLYDGDRRISKIVLLMMSNCKIL